MTGLCEASTTVRTTIPTLHAEAREKSPIAQQVAKVQAIGVPDHITPLSTSSTLTPALPPETIVHAPQSPSTPKEPCRCALCYQERVATGFNFPHFASPTSTQPQMPSEVKRV